MNMRAGVLAPILVSLLTACGTPAGVERAMEGFAEAATDTEQALKDLDQTASERLTEIRHRQAVAAQNTAGERVLVRPLERANCGFEAPGCELRLMTRQDHKAQQQEGVDAGEVLTVDTLIRNQLAIAREISLYATGLRDIATADHTDEVRQGVETAMAGVCGLAGTLGALTAAGAVAKPACEAFRVPITSVVAFVYGEYQAQAKLSAMRRATGEMQPLLEEAADVFSTSAEFALDGDVRRLTEAYERALTDWEGSRSEANLKALLNAAKQLDAALQARAELRSPESVFQAFATTHGEVADALRSNDMDLSAALIEVERLVGKAKQLAQIAQGFKAGIETVKELEGSG